MRYRLVLIILLLAGTNLLKAQQSVNSAGGTATGSGGAVTFTTGQSTYTVADGTGGSSSTGVQQAYVITQTGISQPNQSVWVRVYPNPTAHILQIDAEHAQGFHFQLIDAAGKNVHNGKIKNGKAVLDMSSYAPGNYQLIVLRKNNKQQTFNILKNSL
jgi:hypothetical protein